jgi:hypothetical protein
MVHACNPSHIESGSKRIRAGPVLAKLAWDPISKIKLKKKKLKDLECSSSSTALTLQAQDPEFNSQYHKKEMIFIIFFNIRG